MINIRPGNSKDIPALKQIELSAASLFSSEDLPSHLACPASKEELEHALESKLLWVAQTSDGTLVGFIACEQIGNALHIVEMDVSPNHGKQGIGSMLLNTAIKRATVMPNTKVITLTTFAHLPWNAPFYAKHGFLPLKGGGSYHHLECALSLETSRGLKNRIAMAKTTT